VDYKSVLEEQISKLQKIQEQNINDSIEDLFKQKKIMGLLNR